jgi:hypothetical protein
MAPFISTPGVKGCYDATTGNITFTQSPCGYTGCYVATGIHAGQIKIVVDNVCCDDTYYACYDADTGEFEIPTPDDCCPITGGCDCAFCGGPCTAYSPNEITVNVSGVTECTDCLISGNSSLKWRLLWYTHITTKHNVFK